MRYQDNPLIRAKYNCSRWKKVRNMKILKVNGLCERCLKKRIYKEGVIVHHKIEITEDNYMDDNLMYGLDNLEFLCMECHSFRHQKHKDYIFDEEGNVLKADI